MWILWVMSTKSVKTKVVFQYDRPAEAVLRRFAYDTFKNPVDYGIAEAR